MRVLIWKQWLCKEKEEGKKKRRSFSPGADLCEETCIHNGKQSHQGRHCRCTYIVKFFFFFLVPWQPTASSLPYAPPSLFLSPAVSISLPPIDPFLRHFSLATLRSLCSVAPFPGVTADVRERTGGGFIVPRGRRRRRFTVDTTSNGGKKTAPDSDCSRVPDPGWWS